jgi:hypothetical protein
MLSNKARQAGEVFPEKTQHPCSRAPEVYLGYPCTGALDIWALVCIVRPSHRERRESTTSFADDTRTREQTFWFVTGDTLFKDYFGFIEPETQLANIVEVLGTTIPIEMKKRSQHWDRYIDEEGGCVRPSRTARFCVGDRYLELVSFGNSGDFIYEGQKGSLKGASTFHAGPTPS